jgi:hypothetical protein
MKVIRENRGTTNGKKREGKREKNLHRSEKVGKTRKKAFITKKKGEERELLFVFESSHVFILFQ